jgi:hypothetical protein
LLNPRPAHPPVVFFVEKCVSGRCSIREVQKGHANIFTSEFKKAFFILPRNKTFNVKFFHDSLYAIAFLGFSQRWVFKNTSKKLTKINKTIGEKSSFVLAARLFDPKKTLYQKKCFSRPLAVDMHMDWTEARSMDILNMASRCPPPTAHPVATQLQPAERTLEINDCASCCSPTGCIQLNTCCGWIPYNAGIMRPGLIP